MKVLIGPVEIAGFCASLYKGLKSIGINAEVIDLSGHPFGYSKEIESGFLTSLINRAALQFNSSRPWRIIYEKLGIKLVICLIISIISCFKYDTFIFVFGKSLLPYNLDLPVFRILSKKIVFIYLGSDSRPLILNGAYLARNEWLTTESSRHRIILDQAKTIAGIERVEKYADIVIDSPMSAHSHTRSCANWFRLGFPTQLPEHIVPLPSLEILRILHAPSNAAYKGSQEIRKVIDSLKASGIPIDFVELRNRSNREVIESIQKCHVVIDELYSDTGLAGLGVESASHGRIVVVGGEDWDSVRKWMSTGNFPSLLIAPNELEEAIRKLWKEREEWKNIANQHHVFIKECWAATKVAQRLVSWIEHGVPFEDQFNPADLTSIKGMGAPNARIRESLISMLGSHTPSELGFKPGSKSFEIVSQLLHLH